MFSTPKRTEGYAPSESMGSSSGTVIARGVRVEGDFTSPGDVMIEGEVHGHVTTGGMLTVGSEAKLKADVTADEAVIAGTIEGNVIVKKRLELKSTAKMLGDLTCETVAVEAGAAINGKVAIGNAKPEKSPSAATKTSAHAASESSAA